MNAIRIPIAVVMAHASQEYASAVMDTQESAVIRQVKTS